MIFTALRKRLELYEGLEGPLLSSTYSCLSSCTIFLSSFSMAAASLPEHTKALAWSPFPGILAAPDSAHSI